MFGKPKQIHNSLTSLIGLSGSISQIRSLVSKGEIEKAETEAEKFEKEAKVAFKNDKQKYDYYIANLHLALKKPEAINEFEKLAEDGDVDACLVCGYIYYFGNDDIEEDYKEAFKYFKLAADRGNNEAMFTCGTMYDDGKGIRQNKQTATRYYKMAADRGNNDAKNNYAVMLINGEGVEQDVRKAKEIFISMEEIEDPIFKFNIGNLEYFLGNKVKAYQYFNKSSDLGCNEAQFLQGKMLYEGDGMKRNRNIGADLIINAAKNGNLNAMIYICYNDDLKNILINKAKKDIELKRFLKNLPKKIIEIYQQQYEGKISFDKTIDNSLIIKSIAKDLNKHTEDNKKKIEEGIKKMNKNLTHTYIDSDSISEESYKETNVLNDDDDDDYPKKPNKKGKKVKETSFDDDSSSDKKSVKKVSKKKRTVGGCTPKIVETYNYDKDLKSYNDKKYTRTKQKSFDDDDSSSIEEPKKKKVKETYQQQCSMKIDFSQTIKNPQIIEYTLKGQNKHTRNNKIDVEKIEEIPNYDDDNSPAIEEPKEEKVKILKSRIRVYKNLLYGVVSLLKKIKGAKITVKPKKLNSLNTELGQCIDDFNNQLEEGIDLVELSCVAEKVKKEDEDLTKDIDSAILTIENRIGKKSRQKK